MNGPSMWLAVSIWAAMFAFEAIMLIFVWCFVAAVSQMIHEESSERETKHDP